jgi:hypothetical protein
MYNYPLKFKIISVATYKDLLVLDAQKKEILYRPALTEPVLKGQEPCVIYADTNMQPLYTTLFQEQDGVKSYSIKTADGQILGEMVAEPKKVWKIMDENHNPLATIQIKATWKNSCLFQIITLPFDEDIQNLIFKTLAPYRYIVTMNGNKVLELRETVSISNADHSLKKSGDFWDRQEALLLVSLIMSLEIQE